MSDTIRTYAFEGDINGVQALVPQAIADATPVLSSAINTNTYPRTRMLLVANVKETTATVHTIAFTVTESATSGGSYAAATTSGDLTALSADGFQFASIKRNAAKPFIKVTATGSHADVDVIVSAAVLFLGDSV
jgi:hypothetical protein